MNKSKGHKLKEWRTAAGFFATEKGLTRFVTTPILDKLYGNGIEHTKIFDHVFAMLIDGQDFKCLAIYPVSKAGKFAHLLKYKDYREELATDDDIKENPHCVMRSTERIKKDLSTPLFGELPEVRKRGRW